MPTATGPAPRGSVKSGQVVGWVMSLMARFGCRDRDLVVEAIAAWAPWARRMRLMARLRSAAMTCGPLAVRSWWRSSSKMTSLTQWSRFSIPQCPWIQAATCSGWASGMDREQTRVDYLNVLPALDGPGASDLDHLRSPGEVGASTALTVRRTRRPWPVSTLETDGTFFQGRALRVRCRLFWLPLTVRR